ncbi:MAG: glycosyltransferase family 4 protein [bacterium]
MTNAPRILFVSPRMIDPPFSGGEKWVHEVLRRLSSDHRLALAVFTAPCMDKIHAAMALRLESSFLDRVCLLPFRRNSRPEKGMPPSPGRWFSREAVSALSGFMRDWRPDIIHLQFYETLAYAAAIPENIPFVYTEHDAGYLKPGLSYVKGRTGLAGWLRMPEIVRAAFFVRRMLESAAAVTSLSGTDARRISRVAGVRNCLLTPNAVDTGEFRPARHRNHGHTVLFVGHYPHFPNEDAAVRLAAGIMPLVRRRFPEAKLVLAGSNPTPRVFSLADSRTEVTGTVESVLDLLQSADIFAAPVRYGSGCKGKILEAFSCAVPVVADTRALSGIAGAVHGTHAFTSGTEKGMAKLISGLLENPQQGARAGQKARELVVRSHGWEQAVSVLRSLYGAILSGKEFTSAE